MTAHPLLFPNPLSLRPPCTSRSGIARRHMALKESREAAEVTKLLHSAHEDVSEAQALAPHTKEFVDEKVSAPHWFTHYHFLTLFLFFLLHC